MFGFIKKKQLEFALTIISLGLIAIPKDLLTDGDTMSIYLRAYKDGQRDALDKISDRFDLRRLYQ